MNEKVDYSAYSDDELDQAIKDIQNVKLNRKKSYKQKIFLRCLSNSENEQLKTNENMIKTYIIGYAANTNHKNGDSYVIQNNSNDKCSLCYNFTQMNNCDKKYIGDLLWTGAVLYSVDSLISFYYNEN